MKLAPADETVLLEAAAFHLRAGDEIAALVILGPRLWPAIVLGDLLLADRSSPWGTILGQTVGNTLEVVERRQP